MSTAMPSMPSKTLSREDRKFTLLILGGSVGVVTAPEGVDAQSGHDALAWSPTDPQVGQTDSSMR